MKHQRFESFTVRASDDDDDGMTIDRAVIASTRRVWGERITKRAFNDWMKDAADYIPMLRQHDQARQFGEWFDFELAKNDDDDEYELLAAGKMYDGFRDSAEVKALVDRERIRGVSIGFRGGAYGWDDETSTLMIDRVDVYEGSLALFPADRTAGLRSERDALIAKLSGRTANPGGGLPLDLQLMQELIGGNHDGRS